MNRILLIEDDIWITKSLKLYLENLSFKIFVHNTWDKAIDQIKKTNPDLIILDINLPVMNWIDICKNLRNFSNIPIIMLSARDSEIDRINWLELWADDYISKPFSPRELLARIKIILKRTENLKLIKNENIFLRNSLYLDKNKRLVLLDWNNINFTKNEYEIFEKIFDENWKIVTRETLMTQIIWYNNYLYDRTLDTHIKNIRRKLGKENIILTIRWKWYRFNK